MPSPFPGMDPFLEGAGWEDFHATFNTVIREYVWTIRDPLPTFPVPLKKGDPDVLLDLPAIFTTVYDRARYDLSLDYAASRDPRFSEADLGWVQRRTSHGRPEGGRTARGGAYGK